MSFQKLSGERITWIDIADPTLHDVGIIRRLYPFLHPLNLEDVLSKIERPKIDEHEEYIFIVAHFPLFDHAQRLSRPSEINFFIGRDFLITIHDDRLKILRRTFEECQGNRDQCHRLLGKSSGHAFYVLLDKLVDSIFPMLEKVEGNIRRVEEEIFDAEGVDMIRNIALVRRDTIALRRIIRHLVSIISQIDRMRTSLIHEDLEEYFGDIVDHIQRARDIIDEDVEIISGLSETADTLLSHKINAVIRILTVFSVIMLPLTFVTSMFGMNVLLPLQDHPDAFLFITVVMLLISGAMIAYFRYRHWI
ncbi:MAG: magnesium transporter CorA family protein [Candidatus Flexifilum sp.]